MPNRLNATGVIQFSPEDRPLVKTPDLEMTFKPDSKNYAQGIQNIGTSEENLNVGDVSSIGLIVLINRGDTNYIEVGLTGSYTIKLKPGQFTVFPPAGTITAVANSGAEDLEYWIFPEDT